MIFDDVKAPRERVFIDGDIDVYNSVMGTHGVVGQHHAADHHWCAHQAGVCVLFPPREWPRPKTKSRPGTMEMLGELSSYVEVTRKSVLLSEEHAFDRGDGAIFPDGRPMHPMRSMLAVWYPRVREILMLIGGHNLLATPSKAMFADARLRPLIDEFVNGANDVDAERRARIYRLAWDFIGSGLASRNELYERNYLSSAKTSRTHHTLMYSDRERPTRPVDAMLT